MKRTFSAVFVIVFLMLVMLVIPTTQIRADESIIDDNKFLLISSYNGTISISGITASCSARISARSASSLSITMELQKKSGSDYTTVETWTKAGTGTSLSDSRSKLINIFSTYRLKATLTAGSESVVIYRYP